MGADHKQTDDVITLPWPPSINHYWRHSRGRHYISKEGIAYRKQVWALCNALDTCTGRLRLEVDLHPPDKRRRDIDNVLKALLDALQHAGMYVDDEQIDQLLITRCPMIKGGWVRIKLSSYRSIGHEPDSTIC